MHRTVPVRQLSFLYPLSRICLVLFACMSDTEVCNDLCPNSATEEQSVLIQAPQRPSKPGRPVTKCYRGIYVMVKWTLPEDDITRYVIKYGDEDTNVNKYATVTVTGNKTDFQFTDQLEQWRSYRFAIAAENTAGQGEFSEFSDCIFTQHGK